MNRPIVEVEARIQAPPHAVWEAITKKPSAMFMGANVETDWKVGHPITMSGEFKGKSFKDSGEIRSFDIDRELSFTHFSGGSDQAQRRENGNLVTIRLQPDGDATRVVLSQSALGAREVTDSQKAEFRKNWSAMLQALKTESETAAKEKA
jgi:uncharacterized protein YndB with AHSA1/START domain